MCSLGVRRCQLGGTFVGCRGLAVPAQPPEQIGPCGVERVVVVQIQLVHQSQRRSRARHLADGDRAVEGHDRRRGKSKQLVVQSQDPRPVGLLDGRCVRVHDVDGRLELIRTWLVAAKARAEDGSAFLDHGSIPLCAILLAEQHQGAVGPRSRRAT